MSFGVLTISGVSLLWEYLAQFGVDKYDLNTWNWADPFRKGIVPGT